MFTDTEGIVLRQTKTVNGRRMLVLFTKKYGKISVGTSINEKGRSKAALALRPFTYGKYELYKTNDYFNLNGADVLKSYFKLGEDVEKYMASSYALEFTDKVLEEGMPVPELFKLILDFLDEMENRKKNHSTLTMAYQVKLLNVMGSAPRLDACVCCGKSDDFGGISINEGGVVCSECAKQCNGLIFPLNFGILNVLKYIMYNPLSKLAGLALSQEPSKLMHQILKAYAEQHFEIKELKSESFFESSI